MKMSRLAIVQNAPVLLDRDKTIQLSLSMLEEAVKEGAEVIVFPEAFIPGYPTWIWRLKPGADYAITEEIHARLLSNAVNLDNDDLKPLREAAKRHKVTVVCGIDERAGDLSQSTLYNTVVVIGPDGNIANRHRKLMPTNPERMVWGFGDASGLKTIETACGRIGTLICWENYMPLARYALYCQGLELYIAPTWDSGDDWIGTLCHIAREGRCWVAGSGTAIGYKDIPDDFPNKDKIFAESEEWINPGDSVVIDPGGYIVAGPLRCEQGILYADIDPGRVAPARRNLDVTGHYARPDIFQLHVNTNQQKPIILSGDKS
jgi:nitrilase